MVVGHNTSTKHVINNDATTADAEKTATVKVADVSMPVAVYCSNNDDGMTAAAQFEWFNYKKLTPVASKSKMVTAVVSLYLLSTVQGHEQRGWLSGEAALL